MDKPVSRSSITLCSVGVDGVDLVFMLYFLMVLLGCVIPGFFEIVLACIEDLPEAEDAGTSYGLSFLVLAPCLSY